MRGGPIFVGGLSGSGKTLLRLMLSSHPKIAMTRRTYMWTRFYQQYGNLDDPGNFGRCLNAMLSNKHIRVLNPDPERIRQEFWQGERTYCRLFALFHEHHAEQLGKVRWGDQLGLVEHYADPIFAAYPGARMIHMIREPSDRYGASIARSRRRIGRVGPATARWLRSAEWARRNEQRYPERYTVVRYEALVSERETTLREICAFLDEEFVPGMLTMEGALRFGEVDDDEPEDEGEFGGAVGALDGQGPAALSKREVAFIQAHAKMDMMIWGYQPAATPLSLVDRLLFYTVDWPINTAGMVAWRLRSGGSARSS